MSDKTKMMKELGLLISAMDKMFKLEKFTREEYELLIETTEKSNDNMARIQLEEYVKEVGLSETIIYN